MDAPVQSRRIDALVQHMRAGLVGRDDLVERLLIGLLAGRHVLIEGAPGLGKTRAVKLLASGVDLSFARVQCTPDLMPADLTGTPVFRQDLGTFEFVEGPVFNGLVLVDEVNRAPPKVQSALLEAMGEHQVTAGGRTYPLPDPFMVVATQNPIEHEGTFPLPEAQLDRFLLYVRLDPPDSDTEMRILDLVETEYAQDLPALDAPLPAAEVIAARDAAMATYLAPALKDYIVRLVTATRSGSDPDDDIAGAVEHPISPRGTLALAAAAKARAWLQGRDHATPEDVRALARDALSHRVALTWRAAAEGLTPVGLVERMLAEIDPL